MSQEESLSDIPVIAIKRVKGEIADVFEISVKKEKSEAQGVLKMMKTLKHMVNSDWKSYEIFYGKSFEDLKVELKTT